MGSFFFFGSRSLDDSNLPCWADYDASRAISRNQASGADFQDEECDSLIGTLPDLRTRAAAVASRKTDSGSSNSQPSIKRPYVTSWMLRLNCFRRPLSSVRPEVLPYCAQVRIKLSGVFFLL